MDENKDAPEDYKDGNEGLKEVKSNYLSRTSDASLKDPGRQGRRRSEEPWTGYHLMMPI